MARLIAKHTLEAAILKRDANGDIVLDAKRKPIVVKRVSVEPGKAFNPEDLGIEDSEIAELVAAGAVEEEGAYRGRTITSAAADLTQHPPRGGGDAPPAREEMEKLSRAELDALAAERGVDISAARNKADVIEAILAQP